MGDGGSPECGVSLLPGTGFQKAGWTHGPEACTRLGEVKPVDHARGGTLVPKLGGAICCHEAEVKISGQDYRGQGVTPFFQWGPMPSLSPYPGEAGPRVALGAPTALSSSPVLALAVGLSRGPQGSAAPGPCWVRRAVGTHTVRIGVRNDYRNVRLI